MPAGTLLVACDLLYYEPIIEADLGGAEELTHLEPPNPGPADTRGATGCGLYNMGGRGPLCPAAGLIHAQGGYGTCKCKPPSLSIVRSNSLSRYYSSETSCLLCFSFGRWGGNSWLCSPGRAAYIWPRMWT